MFFNLSSTELDFIRALTQYKKNLLFQDKFLHHILLDNFFFCLQLTFQKKMKRIYLRLCHLKLISVAFKSKRS